MVKSQKIGIKYLYCTLLIFFLLCSYLFSPFRCLLLVLNLCQSGLAFGYRRCSHASDQSLRCTRHDTSIRDGSVNVTAAVSKDTAELSLLQTSTARQSTSTTSLSQRQRAAAQAVHVSTMLALVDMFESTSGVAEATPPFLSGGNGSFSIALGKKGCDTASRLTYRYYIFPSARLHVGSVLTIHMLLTSTPQHIAAPRPRP